MYHKNMIIKPGVYPGEYAWEVMQQSKRYGEKPLRLVLGKEAIRTVTSLALTEPSEIKEYWKVPSAQLLKVSWCPELCVLSVLYFNKEEQTKELTKVFFVDLFTGKKILKCYKKIKPATVHLSPGRPKPKLKKKYVEVKEKENTQTLSTSFQLTKSLNNEKFWRAMEVNDDVEVTEIFLGVSPTGIRIVYPSSPEAELVVDNLHVLSLGFTTYYGNNNMLKLKYLSDEFQKTKTRKKCFYVLPITAKDILSHHELCSTLGEENNLIDNISKMKIPDITDNPVQEEPVTSNLESEQNNQIKTRTRSLSEKNRGNSKKLTRGLSAGSLSASRKEQIIKEKKEILNTVPIPVDEVSTYGKTDKIKKKHQKDKENIPVNWISSENEIPRKLNKTTSRSAMDLTLRYSCEPQPQKHKVTHV